jgi:hypothetical protein
MLEIGVPSRSELALLRTAQDKFPARRRAGSLTRGGMKAKGYRALR